MKKDYFQSKLIKYPTYILGGHDDGPPSDDDETEEKEEDTSTMDELIALIKALFPFYV